MEQLSLLTSILTSVLTGGILVLFIENQHLTSYVWTKYESIMTPFIHKLTCVIKYISLCNSAIEEPDTPNPSLTAYKKRLDYFRSYNFITIMGGRDFPIDYFAARNLDEICEKVNDIWYFGDRYPADLEGFFVNETVYGDNAKKLLLEIFEKKTFFQEHLTIRLLNNVTGQFYSEIYQPIKNIPLYFDVWKKRSTYFKCLSISSIIICINTFILLLVWPNIPSCWIILLTIFSLIIFSFDLFYLLHLDVFSRKMFK